MEFVELFFMLITAVLCPPEPSKELREARAAEHPSAGQDSDARYWDRAHTAVGAFSYWPAPVAGFGAAALGPWALAESLPWYGWVVAGLVAGTVCGGLWRVMLSPLYLLVERRLCKAYHRRHEALPVSAGGTPVAIGSSAASKELGEGSSTSIDASVPEQASDQRPTLLRKR